MLKILLITSNSKRHQYFKLRLENYKSKKYKIIFTFIEKENFKIDKVFKSNLEKNHLDARNISEMDFFDNYISNFEIKNRNTKIINKGEINKNKNINFILKQNPDFIVTYGCSIIRGKLLKSMKNKIINVHLGLSPYYLGAGTNFHALTNRDFQCVGYTFLYMDEGVDTGKIIHQSRAKIYPFDSPHQIGNRLILQMVNDIISLLENINKIKKIKINKFVNSKIYYKKDFNRKAVYNLYKGFNNSIIKYLNKRKKIEDKFPLILQKFIK